MNMDNHASHFAPGAITLGVMALELFLNHLIVAASERSDAEIQQDLDKKTLAKLDFLARSFGTKCSQHADLEIVIEVRNEVAHHFPRPGNEKTNLPPWFAELEHRKLFISSGREDKIDFNLSQKLGSFKLAFWANRVIVSTVADLLSGSSHWIVAMNAFEHSNFPSLLHGVPAPESFSKSEKTTGD